jgi:Helix-turn-helix domain
MTDSSEQTLTLSVEEAAGLLRISRGLAYELVHRGELAAIRGSPHPGSPPCHRVSRQPAWQRCLVPLVRCARPRGQRHVIAGEREHRRSGPQLGFLRSGDRGPR